MNCGRVSDSGVKCTDVKGHGGDHNHGEEIWEDLRPWSDKVEWHLTLSCDLDCAGCNRASFLREPHTRRMTLEDAREFIRQADELQWHPKTLVIIGGEPTMHPDFLEFVKMGVIWAREVQVWSNAHSEKARRLAAEALRLGAAVCADTQKPDGSVQEDLTQRANGDYWTNDIYISPADQGKPVRKPCFQHSALICGVSVDGDGYTPCAMGGMIAGLVAPEGRTKVLADLFDREKVAAMTRALCRHCGHAMHYDPQEVDIKSLPRRFKTPMSPTWEKAFKNRK